MKSSYRTWKIFRRSFIVLLALSATVLVGAFAIFKWPRMYQIADNYRGWAIVKYDDRSCPPLRHNGIFLIIPINSSGRGCTSSPLRLGWLIEFYEYVSGGKVVRRLRETRWGQGGEIWAGYLMPDKESEVFFVGTETELRQSWSRSPH